MTRKNTFSVYEKVDEGKHIFNVPKYVLRSLARDGVNNNKKNHGNDDDDDDVVVFVFVLGGGEVGEK